MRQRDCDLLDFDYSGTARRNPNRPLSTLERAVGICRVKESIRIYGLDRPGLNEHRRRAWKDLVFKAKVLDSNIFIDDAVDEVRELIAPEAPHSSAALSALRSRRDLRSVVEHFADELGTGPSIDSVAQQDAHTVSDLINADALKAGVELVGVADFGEVAALLLPDGAFELGARSYATPTSAARAATGSADVEGWDFWHIAVASGRVSLSQIRRELNEGLN
ncbi:hypothetical protein [Streptomyces sp. NPDC047070]|uniref:restriction system modified-DNA reader domain-containing protein n=1 Tax=Streptomyces sp. NPDC047070 TaxID=3154923 RepID=UPI0034543261